jgi:DNA-binding transcriptional ArsR family regulator
MNLLNNVPSVEHSKTKANLIFNDAWNAQPTVSPSGCDLDCKEELFRNLADRSRLSILQVLCQGAKTVSQVSAATRLPQPDVSSQLGHLLECGCVTSRHTKNSVLYELSTPRLLQLEAVVDELLLASLKHRASRRRTE